MSYLDETEEERRQREAEALPVSQPIAVQAAEAVTPTASIAQVAQKPYSNPMLDQVIQRLSSYKASPEDQALQGRWRDTENQQLDRAQQGTNYGWAEGVRDLAPLLVGGFLDATTNHGRGAANLAALSAQQIGTNYDRDQKRLAADREFAIQAAQRRQAGADREFTQLSQLGNLLTEKDRINIAMGNLGARNGAVATQKAAEARKADESSFANNPDDPRKNAVIAQMNANLKEAGSDYVIPSNITGKGLALLAQQNGKLFDLANMDEETKELIRRAGGTSAASTAARINTENNLAPVSADTKRQEAIGSKTGEAQGNALNVGLTEQTNQQLGQDNPAAKSFYTDMEPALKSTQALSEVLKRKNENGVVPGLDIKNRIANAIPGGGFVMSPEAKEVYQQLDLANEFFSRDQSGAAISVKESAKFLREQMGNPASSQADITRALERFQGAMTNAIRARAASNPGAAQQVVDSMGLDMDLSPPAPRARVPSGGMVTIELGGESRQVSREQAQRIKKLNPSVRIVE